MSEIPISSVVRVNITTTPQTPSEKGFGTLLAIGQSDNADANKTLNLGFFSSLADVAEVHTSTDEVYKMANTYFAQNPKPDSLYIGWRYTVAQKSWIEGSALVDTTIANWQAITDGSFRVKIDGAEENVTALDFNAVADMDDVASVIDAGSANYNCTWDGTKLFLENPTTGSASTIELPYDGAGVGTYIGEISGLGQTFGTRIYGVDAETAVKDCLDRLDSENSDWYAFAFTKETRENQDVKDSAEWAEAKIKEFFTTTNNSDVFDASIETDIAFFLNEKGYRRTWVQAHDIYDEYPEVSSWGRSATVDFQQEDSTLTLKFKDLPTITPMNITQGQLNTAIAKGANVYHNISTVSMLSEGVMSAGIGVWQDTVHGVDWLQNSIETAVFALLRVKKKVPFTDKGTALIEQQVVASLEQGVQNGLIADSGTTIDGEFLPNGFTTSTKPVSEIPLSEKQTRQYSAVYFTAIGAGAIHGVTIEGTFEG